MRRGELLEEALLDDFGDTKSASEEGKEDKSGVISIRIEFDFNPPFGEAAIIPPATLWFLWRSGIVFLE